MSHGRHVAADLHKAGLGLSAEDEARIVNEVQFVIHSAASISFFEHIHTLLEQNYEVRLLPCPSPHRPGGPPLPCGAAPVERRCHASFAVVGSCDRHT